jgi:hypothetical protein
MLSRIYSAPGGTEALDVLMKYMYDSTSFCLLHVAQQAIREGAVGSESLADTSICSYKGMAQAAPASSARNITPQATGFSQVHSRGGGEGGGQAMSVLLSWHEKVRCSTSCFIRQPFVFSTTFKAQLLTTAIACGGSRSRKHRQGHDRSPHSLSRLHVLSPYLLRADHLLPHTEDNAFPTASTAAGNQLQSSYQQTTSCTSPTCFSPVLRCDLPQAQFIYPESILRHDNPAAASIFIKLLNFSAGPTTLSMQSSRRKSTDVSFFRAFKASSFSLTF